MGAEFQGRVDLNRAVFAGSALFRPTASGTAVTFAEDVNFSGATFGYQAEFRDAQFKMDAYFVDARFKAGVRFLGTKFSQRALFYRVVFDGPAVFTHEGETFAAVFRGPAIFEGSRFRGPTHFQSVIFLDGCVFAGTVFNADTWFEGALFGGETDFRAIESTLEARFTDSRFLERADFREARFRVVYFQLEQGNSNPRSESIGDAKRMANRSSLEKNSLLVMEIDEPFFSTVDFRGLTYERMYARWERLLGRQEPYDRQPYSELEKSLRRIGEDRTANDIYFAQRMRELRNRLDLDGSRDWFGALSDFMYCVGAGFGVRPLLLVFWSALFVLLGSVVFERVGAVVYREQVERVLHGNQPLDLSMLEAFQVSLDQFLPIEVPGGQLWEPSAATWVEQGPVVVSYGLAGTFLSLFGWMLVPVLIATIVDVLRRRSVAQDIQ